MKSIKLDKQKKIFKFIFITIIITLAFFIPMHPEWCLSDDYLVFTRTGMGHPFLPEYQCAPQLGRFFPLAYLPYNILLLFHSGYISAFNHYIFLAVCFIITFVLLYLMFKKIICDTSKKPDLMAEILIVSAVIILIQRSYEGFMTLFSTCGISCCICSIYLFVLYYFCKKNHWTLCIVLCLLMVWITYASESNFLIPLCIGTSGLLFSKQLSFQKKFTYSFLILNAILFLLFYYYFYFLYTTSQYDPGHGTSDSILQNAVKMSWNMKLLWIALPLGGYRLSQIIKNKDNFKPFYDTTLFTGLAIVLGNFILKLNLSLYYIIPSFFVMPAIILWALTCKRRHISHILIYCLAIFYLIKIPGIIEKQYNNREHDRAFVNNIIEFKHKGYHLSWSDINENLWCYLVINGYVQYLEHNENYFIPEFYDLNSLPDNNIVMSSKVLEHDIRFTEKLKRFSHSLNLKLINQPEEVWGITIYELSKND